jgi:cytochrome c553
MTMSLLTVSLLACVGMSAANAADTDKGNRSSICAACHGVTGISKQDVWPNLAGQKAGYITAQLKQYQTSVRKDAVMESLAKLLTDEEIEKLAAYFAQQTTAEPQSLKKATVTAPNEGRAVD